MLSKPPPDRLTVIVASPDAAFRRLAGAALSRVGHEVHTAAATPNRLERLVRLRHPEVVIFDVSSGAEPPSPDSLGGLRAAPAVVLVSEHRVPAALHKWAPLDDLTAATESAARARPGLRVIAGGQ
jgi:hypothetical protein